MQFFADFDQKSLGFKDKELKNHSDTYLLTLLSWFSNLFIAVFNAIINASARNDLTRAAVRRSAQVWYSGVNIFQKPHLELLHLNSTHFR